MSPRIRELLPSWLAGSAIAWAVGGDIGGPEGGAVGGLAGGVVIALGLRRLELAEPGVRENAENRRPMVWHWAAGYALGGGITRVLGERFGYGVLEEAVWAGAFLIGGAIAGAIGGYGLGLSLTDGRGSVPILLAVMLGGSLGVAGAVGFVAAILISPLFLALHGYGIEFRVISAVILATGGAVAGAIGGTSYVLLATRSRKWIWAE